MARVPDFGPELCYILHLVIFSKICHEKYYLSSHLFEITTLWPCVFKDLVFYRTFEPNSMI